MPVVTARRHARARASSAATTGSRRRSSVGARLATSGRRPTRRSARRSAPSGGSLGPVGFAGEIVADEALREGQFVAGANRTAGTCAASRPAATTSRASPTSASRRRATRARTAAAARLPDRDRGRAHLQARHAYSEPLGATFLDEDGEERPIVMGSYGIGPGRVLAAVGRAARDDERDRLAGGDRAVRRRRSSRSRRATPRSLARPRRPREALSAAGSRRPARRPRPAPGREVRRRRPVRLPAPRHRRQEDARGRRRRRSRPRDGRGGRIACLDARKTGSRTLMARRRKFSEEPFGADDRAADGGDRADLPRPRREDRLSAGYLNHLVHGNRPVPSKEVVERLARRARRRARALPRVPPARDHRPARGDARLDDRLYKRLSA